MKVLTESEEAAGRRAASLWPQDKPGAGLHRGAGNGEGRGYAVAFMLASYTRESTREKQNTPRIFCFSGKLF